MKYTYRIYEGHVLEFFNGIAVCQWSIKKLQDESDHISSKEFNDSFIRTKKWLNDHLEELL